MPPDLTAFAKEFDIQLLTHNDPKGESTFLFLFSGLLICIIYAVSYIFYEKSKSEGFWTQKRHVKRLSTGLSNSVIAVKNVALFKSMCSDSCVWYFTCANLYLNNASSWALKWSLLPSHVSELMSAATFQEVLQEGAQDLNIAEWKLEWVLRYSIIFKSRGIIKAKGYLVSARKANP